ncbi:MAG: hypothetical protein M1833_000827 [Piccolia ochrophora]|nr:MAG: hypothetical protein M1833_000827 [Piccolia ochrophora]
MASLFSGLGGASSSAPQSTSQQAGSQFGSSSLFPNAANAAKPASANSLFPPASTGQSQQQLFAQSQPSRFTTQPQQSSPFGAQTTAIQPQQGSLFSSKLGGTQQQQQSQPPQGLAFAASQSQQSQNVQGQSQQSQQQQQSQGQGQQSQSSQPAYFDSLLERGKKRQFGGDDNVNLGELPSLQLGLGDISQRVRALGSAGDTTSRAKKVDSKAHYLLAASGITPGSALRDLDGLNAQQANASSLQKHHPTYDTDIDAYVSNLQSQSMLSLIAEGLNRSARDFDAFLEANVSEESDAERQRIYEHFGIIPKGRSGPDGDSTSASPGVREGGAFGRSVRRGRGLNESDKRSGTPSSASAFGRSGLNQSVIGLGGRNGAAQTSLFADVAEKSSSVNPNGLDDRFQREKQEKFAQKIQSLNESRLQERPFPLLHEFASVEAQTGGGDQTSQLVDAYRALIEIVRENASIRSLAEPKAVRERQFTKDYLDEVPRSVQITRMKKRILEGSRRFLEQQFFQNLESIVAKNPREARVGGVPTTVNKVRAYVTLRGSRKDLGADESKLQKVEDDFGWVVVFYLLRSGHIKEAAEYVTSHSAIFRALDRNFVTYITNFYNSEDRRLRRDLQDRINAEYNQRQRIAPEIDPYRMACYKIIGRCDLHKKTLDGIERGVEDWMWIQFSLAREVNRVEENAGEFFGLDEVKTIIREIGQRYFTKSGLESNDGFGTYFFLQILGGMFEQAISFLYPFSYVSAVHFAIALDYYGLLRVSDFMTSDAELLTYSTKQLPQISFGRMLGYYTMDFRAANVEAAVDYLALICLNADLPGEAGKSQAELCHEALRELVLETREFAKLLGDVRSDGQRIKGNIERRLKLISLEGRQEYLRTVTIQAAAVADDNGRTTDAVLLYHLAEEYDNVIAIINRALSEAVSLDIGQTPLRLEPLKPRTEAQQMADAQSGSSLSLTSVDDPATLARNMMGLYNSNALYFGKIKPVNRDACGVLLRMSEIKSLVEQGRWTDALDTITTLNILPLTATATSHITAIRTAAQSVSTLPPVLTRNIGQLLLWTITCCGRQRDNLRSSAFDTPTARTMAAELAGKAKDMMVFAGAVKYQLSPAVFEVLARVGGEVETW